MKVMCPCDTSRAIIVARWAAKLLALTKLLVLTKISAPPKNHVSHCHRTTLWLLIKPRTYGVPVRASSIQVLSHIQCPCPRLVGLPEMDGMLMRHPWYPIGLRVTDGSAPIVRIPISFAQDRCMVHTIPILASRPSPSLKPSFLSWFPCTLNA